MKKELVFLMALLANTAFLSCKKTTDKQPELEVSVPSLNYKVGDTVRFSFSGNADHLVFYSGEAGHEYQSRNRTTLSDSELYLSFSTRVLFGTQADQLRVMASSDFSGVYNITEIKKASWTDITNQFELAEGETVTSSGGVMISDQVIIDKPLYIAFKQVTRNQNVSGRTRTWYVTNFMLNRQAQLGTELSLSDQAGAGFLISSFGNKEAGRSTVTSTQLMLRGNATDLVSETEDWAVSKGLYVFSATPDTGIPIKNYSANPLSGYAYVFTAPGTYTVSFIARNATIDGSKESVKELKITVVPQ